MLFVVVIGVFPLVMELVTPSDVFYTLWVENTQGDRIQQTFGFVLEIRTVRTGHAGAQRLPVIAQVVPGGRMAGLGVRPGDVVMCLPRGRSDFWDELRAAEEGYEATLHLAVPDKVALGCSGARVVVFPGRQRPRTL